MHGCCQAQANTGRLTQLQSSSISQRRGHLPERARSDIMACVISSTYMMKLLQTSFFLLALFACQLPSWSQDHVAVFRPLLKIATGELPPYATTNRPDQGIALNIVRQAFELAGFRVEFNFLPWSRALAESRLGKWDGTAYWGHKPEHDADFILSDNVITEQWVFVSRAELNFKWKDLADLRPYRIALIPDYTYTPEIRAMAQRGEFKSNQFPNDLTVLRMLLLKRADVAPMERNVACDLLSRHFSPAQAARLSADPKLMTESFTTHLMMSRILPASAARIAAFNLGLKKLKSSGEYDKILGQVSCPDAWRLTSGSD